MDDLDLSTDVDIVNHLSDDTNAYTLDMSQDVWNQVLKSTADGKLSIQFDSVNPSLVFSDYKFELTPGSHSDPSLVALIDSDRQLDFSYAIRQHYSINSDPIPIPPSSATIDPASLVNQQPSTTRKRRVLSKETVSSSSSSSSGEDDSSKKKKKKTKSALPNRLINQAPSKGLTPISSPKLDPSPPKAAKKKQRRSGSVSSVSSLPPPAATTSTTSGANKQNHKRQRSLSDNVVNGSSSKQKQSPTLSTSALSDSGHKKSTKEKQRIKKEERWYSSTDDERDNSSKEAGGIKIDTIESFESYKQQFRQAYPAYERLYALLVREREAIERGGAQAATYELDHVERLVRRCANERRALESIKEAMRAFKRANSTIKS